jgi:hypothetical protein
MISPEQLYPILSRTFQVCTKQPIAESKAVAPALIAVGHPWPAFLPYNAFQRYGWETAMQAEVKNISANDIPEWPNWTPTDSTDEFQWLSVAIGPVGTTGADLFQVAVATSGRLKARRHKSKFVGLMVDVFDPRVIEQTLQEFVASIEAPTWEAIVEQLQPTMQWEFADYR